MDRWTEAEGSSDAIKRILQVACLQAREREDELYSRDVMGAMEELTGLSHAELEGIASSLREREVDRFFSVRRQLLLAIGILLVFPGMPIISLLLI